MRALHEKSKVVIQLAGLAVFLRTEQASLPGRLALRNKISKSKKILFSCIPSTLVVPALQNINLVSEFTLRASDGMVRACFFKKQETWQQTSQAGYTCVYLFFVVWSYTSKTF